MKSSIPKIICLALLGFGLYSTAARAEFDVAFGKAHPCSSGAAKVGHATARDELAVFALADKHLNGGGAIGSFVGSGIYNYKTSVKDKDIATWLQKYEQSYRQQIPSIFNFPNTCNLSAAELVAIADYTGDGYTDINSTLRNNPVDPVYAAFSRVIDKALSHLNLVTGPVFKGSAMSLDDLESRWLAGKHLKDIKSFNVVPHKKLDYLFSTSMDFSVAEGFSSTKKDDQVSVLFYINTLTGRFIDPMSQYQNENEVLLQADTTYVIRSAEQNSSGGYSVYLDEWMAAGPLYCGLLYPPSEASEMFGLPNSMAMKDYPNGQARILNIPLSIKVDKSKVAALAKFNTETCVCITGALRGHDDINNTAAAEFDTLTKYTVKPISACKGL